MLTKTQGSFLVRALAITLVLSVLLVGVHQVGASRSELSHSNSQDELTVAAGETSCRYGVASLSSKDEPFLEQLNAGWALNFGPNLHAGVPANVEEVPVIRLDQARDAQGNRLKSYILTAPTSLSILKNLIDSNPPGRLWIIGNEVDRASVQDDLQPDVYATAYHDLYYFIKEQDPTAKIGISGLVQVTPGRLQYLDMVWDAYLEQFGYPMPVDVWNMHIYILPEKNQQGEPTAAAIAVGTDPDLAIWASDGTPALCSRNDVYCYAEHDDLNIFMQQTVAMRQWMKEHGQQNKPLILSEFSVLFPYLEASDPTDCVGCYMFSDEYGNTFDRARVNEWMKETLDYLETAADQQLGYPADNYRLVQRWLWYSTKEPLPTTANNLVEDDYSQLTLLGRTYRDRIAQAGFQVNLLPLRARPALATQALPDTTYSATLSVDILNNGNTATDQAFTVTFYKDAGLNTPIGSVQVDPGVRGCAWYPYQAQIEWNGIDLGPGIHHYWAKIDTGFQIAETNESDNVIRGVLLIDTQQIHLPAIRR